MSARNGAPTASAAPSPATTPLVAAGRVAGRIASSQVRRAVGRGAAAGCGGHAQGRRGYVPKSGARFSRKAREPSWASSVV